MFAFGIDYLMGWAMAAADGARKERAEWPPHPDRVFMALAAGWFETDQDAGEGEALRWLEQLPPPSLHVSTASFRHANGDELPTESYVPVNDTKLSLKQLPEFRSRRPRRFPVAIPDDPVVYLSWTEDLPETHRRCLDSLCLKVTSIGHPASLVRMWVTSNPPAANLVPVTGFAKQRLRIVGPGRLAYLKARCNREAVIGYAEMENRVKSAKGNEKKILQDQLSKAFPNGKPMSFRPEPGIWQSYGEPPSQPKETIPGSIFDPRLIVLSLKNQKLPLTSTLKLTEALRGTLFKACPTPIPEWVSGHNGNGDRTDKPHLAFLPLAFVGSQYADGHLMGIALAIPRDLDPEETSRILEPWLRDEFGVPRPISLFDGKWLECVAELDSRESLPWNLRSETWTGPARVWSTVTPFVLDHHFDGKDKWEKAAETLKDSCERIGLPRPTEAMLHPVSMCEGAPRSNHFQWLTRKKDGGRMHHSHAVITFEQKVEGPVVVGAGRFRGYGFCRPIRQGGEEHV